jgi:hypothetical protein
MKFDQTASARWDSAEWLPIKLKKLSYDFGVELNSEFKIGDSRNKATFIYKRSNNLRAVQLLLGHAKIEIT